MPNVKERTLNEFMLMLFLIGVGYVISLYFKHPETGYFFGMAYLMLLKWGNKVLRES